MPIYEYACRLCDHRLEKLQKFSDAPLTECPACGQPELKKLISATAFQLKGTGWYATDSKPVSKHQSSEPSCAQGACGTQCPAASNHG